MTEQASIRSVPVYPETKKQTIILMIQVVLIPVDVTDDIWKCPVPSLIRR